MFQRDRDLLRLETVVSDVYDLLATFSRSAEKLHALDLQRVDFVLVICIAAPALQRAIGDGRARAWLIRPETEKNHTYEDQHPEGARETYDIAMKQDE